MKRSTNFDDYRDVDKQFDQELENEMKKQQELQKLKNKC